MPPFTKLGRTWTPPTLTCLRVNGIAHAQVVRDALVTTGKPSIEGLREPPVAQGTLDSQHRLAVPRIAAAMRVQIDASGRVFAAILSGAQTAHESPPSSRIRSAVRSSESGSWRDCRNVSTGSAPFGQSRNV